MKDEYEKRYRQQKNQAYFHNKSDDMFLISFEDWKHLWVSSGKWGQRGNKSHEYSLARLDSSKPLTKDNAVVMLNSTRSRLVNKGKVFSEEHREKMSKASKGKPKSEEHRKAMSLAGRKAHARKGHTLSRPLEDE